MFQQVLCASVLTLCFTAVGYGETEVTEQVLFEQGVGPYAFYRIPSLIVTDNGTILAICEGRKGGLSDAGDIDVVQRRSEDGGKTWSGIQVIWDDSANTCGNPCPVIEHQSGTIWMLLTWNAGQVAERDIQPGYGVGSRRVFVSHSTDDGKTWAEPREITKDVKDQAWSWYASGPGAGIQLQHGKNAGRMIIPCDHKVPLENAESFRAHIVYSDDHGKTWQLGGVSPKDQVNECEAVELSDGAVLLNMRNYDRSIPSRQVAVSHDGGLNFQEQTHDAALVEPVCQASIRRVVGPSDRFPKGVILFSNPAHESKRQAMTIKASLDDAKTWTHQRLLYPGSSAYSCLQILPGGQIGCLYERDNYSQMSLAKFPISWVVPEAQRATPSR